MLYLIFILPAFILSIYAQFKVKSTFNKYSKVRAGERYNWCRSCQYDFKTQWYEQCCC